jgi:hypothetical protein
MSQAVKRWQTALTFAKHLKLMCKILEKSRAVQADDPGSRHAHYLQLLRAGTKHGGSMLRAFTAAGKAKSAANVASGLLASGQVVTEATAEEIDNVPLWMQGDASLATEEKMKERQALRYDRYVLTALQRWWEVRRTHRTMPNPCPLLAPLMLTPAAA